MTSFRRLVMGIVEMMAVLSIFFGTFVGGIYGAALGSSGIFGIASNLDINLQGIGHVATTGAVFGFIMGAILGFVLWSTLAGIVFFFAQIERNTRSLLERERFEEPTHRLMEASANRASAGFEFGFVANSVDFTPGRMAAMILCQSILYDRDELINVGWLADW